MKADDIEGSENTTELVELLSGRLSRWSAWRLRRRIAADASLSQEYEELRMLAGDLRRLSGREPVKPAPVWHATSDLPEASVRVGRWTMSRASFIYAYAGLLAAVMGTILLRVGMLKAPVSPPTATKPPAESWIADYPSLKTPFWVEHDRRLGIEEHLKGSDGAQDGTGAALGDFDYKGKCHWKLTGIGEVRFVDAVTGKVVRRGFAHPKNGDHLTDAERRIVPQFEWVEQGKSPVTLTGFGSYPVVLPGGVKLMVEIVPWEKRWTAPKDSDARFWQEHDKRLGIEESLPISSGASDGSGTASGYFGSKMECHWLFTGVGEVRIRNTATGKVLRRGFAHPKSGDQPSAEEGRTTPVLRWEVKNGEPQTFRGFGTFSVSLPDGRKLTAEVVPWEQRWIAPR